jgi:FKBP-type peptidyl-prolyl cis-trans isomerase SlyD
MPRVISFHYTLTDPEGKTLDSSAGHDPLMYMEGSGQIIPGLEERMKDLKVGDKKKIQVPAVEAYGEREQKYIVAVPLDKLPGDVKVGDQFGLGGDPEGHPFSVIDVNSTHATMDANHPLAGVDLTFDVEVVEIREATAEEMSHGHAHGPGGHH